MNSADYQYLKIAKEILQTNILYPTRTQFAAKRIFGKTMEFDVSTGFAPILTTKQVHWKSAIKEILWIYVKGSNRVSELGSKIWDEWALPNGTIGDAYGYQARHWPVFDHQTGYIDEVDQVSVLLEKLKNNPFDRGMIINLWNVSDLPQMALRPCAYETLWMVEEDEIEGDLVLNCKLNQRSGDWPVGVPFNTFQYYVLQRMFAQVSGMKVGRFIHYVNDAHIYENQIGPITTQFGRIQYNLPTLWINPEVKNFNDFKLSDFKLIDYEHHPYIDMGEVAV